MALLDDLIQRLQVLPGVGPKSAQRMALHLLQGRRDAGMALATALSQAMAQVNECKQCRNFTEREICRICEDPHRQSDLLCVVESPADVLAFEQAGGFQGRYFVLHGHLSPLDGIGPDELKLDLLFEQIRQRPLSELILATNPTVEGEATAHFIARSVSAQVGQVSRIAHGVPLGGEIEYTDGGTLAHALQGRRSFG